MTQKPILRLASVRFQPLLPIVVRFSFVPQAVSRYVEDCLFRAEMLHILTPFAKYF